jgi:adenosine/AMP kinase
MMELAVTNLAAIAAGHSFLLFLKNAFPINVLPVLRNVPEICGIFCATANPVQVIVARTDLGRSILGVVDGEPPLGVETANDEQARKAFLRKIGYKLG